MSYGGKIGAELKEKVCNVCWTEWYGQSVKIINEYRLNLREAADRETLSTQMKIFFRMLPAPGIGLSTGTPPPNG
jgi:Fe-S cluster biosynthesis and repair protein YggX